MKNASPNPASSGAPSPGAGTAEFASSLHGLLAMSRAVRGGADVGSVLGTIAQAVAETMGFQTVVLNVYRPEWDDFYVETVYGSDLVRDALLGQIYDWDSWKPLLHPSFLRAGAYFIPNGAFDWSKHKDARFVPDGEPLMDAPEAWHPNDELFVPLERSDGQIVGVMSFGEPLNGLRPTDEQLALAVTLASHAALALEMAQERERLERHQAGLEQLLRVSSQLPQTMSTEAMLSSVCEAVREALAFDKVVIQLLAEDGELLRPAASAGWDDDDARSTALDLLLISRLFDERFEIAGCYLVPSAEAERRVGKSQVVYESVRNGRGPAAWNHHWLVVPLYGADGAVRGVLWADEPTNRLLPTENVLQALRIFANHAMEALAAATQLAETRFLADHDPLTRLLNRRALLHELQEAGEGPQTQQVLALVFLDLDNFKGINDDHGHIVGDRVLARFGSLLAELVRTDDHAFRVGGDEFALLLRDAGEQDAREVVARIIAAVESNIDPLVRTLHASFGIATSNCRQEPEELLRIADEAMYQAKRTGTRIEVAA
jgi:diguanylate cyclase (GGDEF)-like protein